MSEPDDEIVVYGKRKHGGNVVTIEANGLAISGWTSVRITRGIEFCPSSFDISLTEKYPGAADFIVYVGTPCVVKIGFDTVITGYVDRFVVTMHGENHTVQIAGRGKCSDLVDCSAEWQGNQISGSSVLGIAAKLAAPYGIDVDLVAGIEPSSPIPQFNFSIGETPWEIIEKICRYRALIPYEDANGKLVLDRVGSTKAASGFTQGKNIERASISYSMDERFSEYRVYLLSMDVLGDLGDGGNLKSSWKDHFVPRHRIKDIVCEAGAGGADISLQRAKWEVGRRFGRSFRLSLTTDTWRDSETTLWTPNTLVTIDASQLKLDKITWVISQVDYRRDETGTHCDLVIMPPIAFQPEPILLQPTFAAEVQSGAPQ
jgi:prophage tail gpP-like protein